MKKNLILIIILLFSIHGQAMATEINHFILDENKIAMEFSALNDLEKFIDKNQGISLTEIENHQPNLLSGFIAKPNNFKGMEQTFRGGETPLGIPPFIWGCVLGIVGLVLVAILSEDKELTKTQ